MVRSDCKFAIAIKLGSQVGQFCVYVVHRQEVLLLQNENRNNSWRTGLGRDFGRAGAVAMAGCFLLCRASQFSFVDARA